MGPGIRWRRFIVFVLLVMARAVNGAPPDGDIGWPGYNRSYDGGRFTPVAQINPHNVAQLKPVCELRLGEEGPLQTGPLVIGDTMFVTTGHTTVAMNATTCAVRWRHIDDSGQQDPVSVNRGAAYAGGRLFRGMPGARLAALSASSGKVVWSVKVGEPARGEFVSSAPIAWHGMVFAGIAGSDLGVRGRVMGFDAGSGRELWRFNTIPMGSERGADTWSIPETAARGGGGMWTSYTLDPMTGELFVPVGNPAPDFLPDARPGLNLFTDSVVVLDARSGALKWWFQTRPNDGLDYDVSAPPVLHSVARGQARVVVAGKDGYVYSVDRKTHELLFKTPDTTILNADKKPTPEGIRVCPGLSGGVQWNGPAFDPTTRTLYVGSVDWCGTVKRGEAHYVAGQPYFGTDYAGDPTDKATGWVTALDSETGAVRWQFQTPKPVVAGMTPTSGALVFTGDMAGNFYAFDESDGKVLLSLNLGGAIAGGVITYTVAGKQYVATTAGNVTRTPFGKFGSPTMIVLAVRPEQAGEPTTTTLPEVTFTELERKQSVSEAAAGQQRFQESCSACHGLHGEGAGGGGPSLTGAAAPKEVEAIVAVVKKPKPPMPSLYPTPLDDAQVLAIAKYVQELQRTGAH